MKLLGTQRLARLLGSIRPRATAVAMLATLLVSIAGALLLLVIYRGQLQSSLDTTLDQQVTDRVQLLQNGNPPESLTTVLQEEALVWIGTEQGDAVAVGGAIWPLENPVPQEIGQAETIDLLVEERKPDEIEQERMTLRIASARTGPGGLVVLAGAETEVIDEAVLSLGRLFAIAIVPLTMLVGLLTWTTASSALKPVDRIRLRAADIGGGNLSARVPVPERRNELHALATTMNEMLDRLEHHDVGMRQFAADASHELKSPVANLRAMIDTTQIDDPSWERLRSGLSSESDRLTSLIDNLLFLSLEDAGNMNDRSRHVPLDELVFAEVEILAATTQLKLDLSEIEPVEVLGSPAELAQLLRNLLDNAARFASSTIKISIENRHDQIALLVDDDGPGIPEQDRDGIFERFTRLDEGRDRHSGGAGLGLSIVRSIARSHGGSVRALDAPHGGARFVVHLEPAPH